MDQIWQYERLKRERPSRGGSKKSGRMFAPGKRVGVAKEKNGVLHIVAPPNVSVLKHQKLQARCHPQIKENELTRRNDSDSQQESQEE